MKSKENIYSQKLIPSVYDQFIVNALSKRQREFISLLQNNGEIIVAGKSVLVACGNKIKKMAPLTLYSLINKGIVGRQSEWPFNYQLTGIGKEIVINESL